MKSKSKSEIAQAMGTTTRTLYSWMARHRQRLKSMGVEPRQRLLPPKAVKFICEELGLHQEDF